MAGRVRRKSAVELRKERVGMTRQNKYMADEAEERKKLLEQIGSRAKREEIARKRKRSGGNMSEGKWSRWGS